MNVVLLGMPGCGKSTVGVLLAKALLFGFLDTDLLIQNEEDLPLCEILQQRGAEGFKVLENEVLSRISCDRCVIATGGSAVYGREAMAHLKQNAVTVYLKITPSEAKRRIHNITTRGIVMPPKYTLERLYEERAPLYERYADLTVDCMGLTVEQCVTAIAEQLK